MVDGHRSAHREGAVADHPPGSPAVSAEVRRSSSSTGRCRRSASTSRPRSGKAPHARSGSTLAPAASDDVGGGGGVEGVGRGVVVEVAEVGADHDQGLRAAPEPVEQGGDRRRPATWPTTTGTSDQPSPSATCRNGRWTSRLCSVGVGSVVDDDVAQRGDRAARRRRRAGTEPERGGEGVDVGRGPSPAAAPGGWGRAARPG